MGGCTVVVLSGAIVGKYLCVSVVGDGEGCCGAEYPRIKAPPSRFLQDIIGNNIQSAGTNRTSRQPVRSFLSVQTIVLCVRVISPKRIYRQPPAFTLFDLTMKQVNATADRPEHINFTLVHINNDI